MLGSLAQKTTVRRHLPRPAGGDGAWEEPRKAPGPRERPGRVAVQARARAHTRARSQVGRPLPLPLTCCHEQDPCSQNDVPLGLVDPGGRHAHAPEQQQDGAEDGEDTGGPDDSWRKESMGREVGWEPGRQTRPPVPPAPRASCCLRLRFSLAGSTILLLCLVVFCYCLTFSPL